MTAFKSKVSALFLTSIFVMLASCTTNLDNKDCDDLYVYGIVKSTINSPINHKASSLRRLPPLKIHDSVKIKKIQQAILALDKMDINPTENADFVLDFYCGNFKKVEIYGNRAFIYYNGEYFKNDDNFEDFLYKLLKEAENKTN